LGKPRLVSRSRNWDKACPIPEGITVELRMNCASHP
jgi:hypothetical protein